MWYQNKKRFIEFFNEGNLIITDTVRQIYADYLSTDGQDIINNLFKIKYKDKEMYVDTQEEVDDIVKLILSKNYLEYSKINEMLNKEFDLNNVYKRQNTIEGQNIKKETGSVENTRIPNLTEETTYDITDERTPDLTTTRTPNITETTTPNRTTEQTQEGSITNENTNSTKPFDNNNFVETQKNVETRTPNELKTITNETGTENRTETGTDTTTETGTDSHSKTGTESFKKTGIEDETKTLDLSTVDDKNEIHTETYNSLDIIDNYEKLKSFYKQNLYDRIFNDLKELLTLRTWNTSWWDL